MGMASSRRPRPPTRSIDTAGPPPPARCRSDGPEAHDRHWLVRVLDRESMLRVSGSPEARIAAIAGCQRGRIARRQLLAVGVTRDMIASRLKRGLLRPGFAGVYVVGHDAPLRWGAEAAALLAAGPGAQLSHLSAGALWQILPMNAGDGSIHVTVPRATAPRRAGAVFHRTTTLLPRDTRIHQGLPVTSVARALLDVAPLLGPRHVELALDSALRHHCNPLQIADIIERHPRHPGAARLRPLMDSGDPRETVTASEGEELLLALLRRAGLPTPELNVGLHGFSVDALWRAQRVVLEVDGWLFHRTRRSFEDDRAKGAVLAAHGFSVVRATPRQLRDHPMPTAVRMAQALAWAEARAR